MTEVSPGQADEARDVVHTAEAFGALIALAPELPPGVLAKIRAAHEDETVAMCCNAHGEGRECCVDVLTGDVSRYAPERVAEAGETLRRWREQQQRA